MSTLLVRRIEAIVLTGALLLSARRGFSNEVNSTWYERSWQSAEGLPDNSVSGVAQTADGYLWVATAGGLMRFDGLQFQEFPLASQSGVPNRVVRTMYLDRQGRLWLGMDRGPVVCIAPGSMRVFSNGPDDRATGMAEDSAGALWVTYADGRLVRIRAGQLESLDAAAGWPAEGPSSLTTDAEGRLWFAKGRQVGIFAQGKFQTLLTEPGAVACLGQRRGGGVWICAGRTVWSYTEEGGAILAGELPAKPEGIQAGAILEDNSGALWLGTAADGLFRLEGTNVTQVPTSHPEIACLAQDREKNIWVGTGGGGLDRLRPRVLDLLGTESGLPYESVRSVCEDVAGAIWVTTQNGLLVRWDKNRWTVPPRREGQPSGFFSCVAADPKGGLWIGTRDRGLYHLGHGECRNWRQIDGLSSDDVRSILEDSRGEVFVATDTPSRVQRLSDGQVHELKLPVQTRSIRALAEDAAGQVWAGTADGRLLLVRGEDLVEETPGVTNRLFSIRCLYPLPDGSLLIGYAGWGIGWLKNHQYARLTSEQGLHDDYVSQMVADGRGWLWCAGNRGVFEVSLNQLEEAARGLGTRLRCISYSRGEGFPNLQPNYENVPGALRGRDGRLWFPMRTGLVLIHPERVPTSAPAPPVLLERVIVDDQTVALDQRYSPAKPEALAILQGNATSQLLRLSPHLRSLEVQFTALSFSVPENVEFQYRLVGLDDQWVGGTARRVTYSRLPPARYRFEVRACSLAGVWSPKIASLSFVVTPFYWQTWWFRLGSLAVFTLSVAGVVRYVSFRRLHVRLRALEQQAALQRERARIAKDIHDDLGASLTQITYLGELAQQDQGEPVRVSERVLKISSTARQAVRSLDEIVWAVNPRNDTPAHLIDYAGQFAIDYLRTAGIRCRLDFPQEPPPGELSTDLRHNLFLTIKEALHNVVKHAAASEVWLRASFTEQSFEIVIEDNGRGFEQEPDNALADGLRNMRQRMADIGGECRFDSRSGQGTRVVLLLNWPGRNGL